MLRAAAHLSALIKYHKRCPKFGASRERNRRGLKSAGIMTGKRCVWRTAPVRCCPEKCGHIREDGGKKFSFFPPSSVSGYQKDAARFLCTAYPHTAHGLIRRAVSRRRPFPGIWHRAPAQELSRFPIQHRARFVLEIGGILCHNGFSMRTREWTPCFLEGRWAKEPVS